MAITSWVVQGLAFQALDLRGQPFIYLVAEMLRAGHELSLHSRYSGVPPGGRPYVVPRPTINRRATVLCASGMAFSAFLESSDY